MLSVFPYLSNHYLPLPRNNPSHPALWFYPIPLGPRNHMQMEVHHTLMRPPTGLACDGERGGVDHFSMSQLIKITGANTKIS